MFKDKWRRRRSRLYRPNFNMKWRPGKTILGMAGTRKPSRVFLFIYKYCRSSLTSRHSYIHIHQSRIAFYLSTIPNQFPLLGIRFISLSSIQSYFLPSDASLIKFLNIFRVMLTKLSFTWENISDRIEVDTPHTSTDKSSVLLIARYRQWSLQMCYYDHSSSQLIEQPFEQSAKSSTKVRNHNPSNPKSVANCDRALRCNRHTPAPRSLTCARINNDD